MIENLTPAFGVLWGNFQQNWKRSFFYPSLFLVKFLEIMGEILFQQKFIRHAISCFFSVDLIFYP